MRLEHRAGVTRQPHEEPAVAEHEPRRVADLFDKERHAKRVVGVEIDAREQDVRVGGAEVHRHDRDVAERRLVRGTYPQPAEPRHQFERIPGRVRVVDVGCCDAAITGVRHVDGARHVVAQRRVRRVVFGNVIRACSEGECQRGELASVSHEVLPGRRLIRRRPHRNLCIR